MSAAPRQELTAHWRSEIQAFRCDLDLDLTPTIRRMVEDQLEARHEVALRFVRTRLAELDSIDKLDASVRWTMAELFGEQDDPIAD